MSEFELTFKPDGSQELTVDGLVCRIEPKMSSKDVEEFLKWKAQQAMEIEQSDAGVKIPDPKEFNERRYRSLK